MPKKFLKKLLTYSAKYDNLDSQRTTKQILGGYENDKGQYD
jgi:hypothetical protein